MNFNLTKLLKNKSFSVPSKETGKPFEYAYLLDAFEEGQKQGITIDITQIQFATKKREYVIIDAPGHKEFLKNIISGAAKAEAALLIIDAKEGVQEQSKRDAYILRILGKRDNKDVALAGESIGITVADEFFNKRGEVITTSSNAPKVTNGFKENIFWMGKNDLVKNRKYKFKLTIQEVEEEIEEIIRVVDASSLNSSDEVTKVVLNDVAEVIIKTKEKLVFDTFSESSITGRFVIVDGYDVAYGGIIAEHSEVKDIEKSQLFKHGELKAHGDIFEEFYYSVDNYSIKSVSKNSEIYEIGDVVPLKGESFSYPEYIDILVFRGSVAIKIRDGKVLSIIPINEYIYEGYPVVNGRGFGIRIRSNEEAKELFDDYNKVNEIGGKSLANFSNKWLIFDKYRSLVFNGDYI